MIIELPPPQRFIARHFAGTRKFFAKRYMSDAATACRFERITYPFEPAVMDGKRLIALAAGVIEAEEIALAKKYLYLGMYSYQLMIQIKKIFLKFLET